MNKKGQIGGSFGIFRYMIVIFLFVILCAGLIYVSGILNDTFHQVGVMNDATPHPNITFPCIDNQSNTCGGTFNANMTEASDAIWGVNYTSIQSLRMVAIIYILCMAIAIIITGVLERKHPILFPAYILLTGLAVYFAPAISNAYSNLLTSGVFGGELNNFTASNFIILNLPSVVLVIGILSIIGLFFNLIRDNSGGGL